MIKHLGGQHDQSSHGHLHHGSISVSLDSILRNGLSPQAQANFPEEVAGDRRDSVYVTSSYLQARQYAVEAADRLDFESWSTQGHGLEGASLVIFEVDAPETLTPDERGQDGDFRTGTIPPGNIKAYTMLKVNPAGGYFEERTELRKGSVMFVPAIVKSTVDLRKVCADSLRKHMEADRELPVEIELLPLYADGQKVYRGDPVRRPYLGGDPTQEALQEAQALWGDPLFVHATSWRMDYDTLVFVYAVPFEDAPRTFTAVVDQYDPADKSNAGIASHAVEHLALLAERDPEIHDELPAGWHDALNHYTPSPAGMTRQAVFAALKG